MLQSHIAIPALWALQTSLEQKGDCRKRNEFEAVFAGAVSTGDHFPSKQYNIKPTGNAWSMTVTGVGRISKQMPRVGSNGLSVDPPMTFLMDDGATDSQLIKFRDKINRRLFRA